jgi:branched-chain amino acid transport system substrate-binding protein
VPERPSASTNDEENIMQRRTLLHVAASSIVGIGTARAVQADTVGVTANRIKIGNTMPYSGPASSLGAIGRGLSGFFNAVNDKGGINGRRVDFISLDDGYVPARTVEQVRRLVEQEGVAFLLTPLGTPPNSAIQRYMNQKKVPQLLVASGADKWGDWEHFPWTMGWPPSYRTEAQIYTKYMLETVKEPKLAILYQNDDFGKDYLSGVRDVMSSRYDEVVTASVSYEVTDATIDSQAFTLQTTGANVLLTAATPKFAAQMIRRVYDIGWKPTHFLTNVSLSVNSVIVPAGMARAEGVISAGYYKDPTDPEWQSDPGMQEWLAWMKQYLPDADPTDINYVYAFSVGSTAVRVLTQCGDDLSRTNIMKQAANIRNLFIPTLLPGIMVSTSSTNYHPIRQLQLVKWNGKSWARFGGVIQGKDT